MKRKRAELLDAYPPLAGFIVALWSKIDWSKDYNVMLKEVSSKANMSKRRFRHILERNTNPTYLEMYNISRALGGNLFVYPDDRYALSLPDDKHKEIDRLVEHYGKSYSDVLVRLVKLGLEACKTDERKVLDTEGIL